MTVLPRGMRLGFLYTTDWSHEFVAVAAGRVPSHRLFGAAELAAAGHSITHASGGDERVHWRIRQVIWALRSQRSVDAFVATHEAAAVPILVLRRLHVLRRPVVVLGVAVLARCRQRGVVSFLYRWALRGASTIAVYASVQVEPLTEQLGHGVPVRFIPFGVDTSWFTLTTQTRGHDLISVGTNAGKDYPTLVRAAPGDRALLIVTDHANRQSAESSMLPGQRVSFDAHVPIARLRSLYASAQAMVIPLREAEFSSGQTVLLECLATGTPVIVSAVSGIRDYVQGAGADVVTTVPPGDVEALRNALAALRNADDGPAVGQRARRRRAHVVGRFDATSSATALEAYLREAIVLSSGL